MPRYNHLFAVGFSVTTPQEDGDDVSLSDLLVGLQYRLEELRYALPPDEAREAFEDMRDSYLVEDS